MSNEFENYITAHIAKLVKEKHLDVKADTKQQLIDGIVSNVLCEVYPIILNYVSTIVD